MRAGQLVRLRVYGGEATARVVAVNDTHVEVCTDEEFVKAEREHRVPLTVGFSIDSIIEVVKEEKGRITKV